MFELIIHYVMLAYVYATAAFLILRLLNNPCKLRTNGFLSISNSIILIFLLLNLINSIVNFKNCFSDGDILLKSNRHCYIILFASLVFAFGFQLLFFSKKYRIKVWVTIVSTLFILIYFYLVSIIIITTVNYIDVTPSSWHIKYTINDHLSMILRATAFFILCFSLSTPKHNENMRQNSN